MVIRISFWRIMTSYEHWNILSLPLFLQCDFLSLISEILSFQFYPTGLKTMSNFIAHIGIEVRYKGLLAAILISYQLHYEPLEAYRIYGKSIANRLRHMLPFANITLTRRDFIFIATHWYVWSTYSTK